MKKFMHFVLIIPVIAFYLFISACTEVDNQKIITEEMQPVVNPQPDIATLENNEQHKVLVAIVDTGVDYNHPVLASHIHYVFDEKGKATRTGYDYVAEDNWPSPYLALTTHLDHKPEDYEYRDAMELINGAKIFLERHPEYAKFIHPFRHHSDEESSGSYHGTHVAGLAVYDNPAIGILPYRVLPYAKGNDRTIENFIIRAIDKAAEDGARVVNFSLGGFFKRSDRRYREDMAKAKRIEAAMKRHPHILFVAAAGNDGTWMDGDARVGYPCGMQAPNLVCVASLNDKFEISDFTNIPLQDTPVFFALGEKVVSTMPVQLCMARYSLDQIGRELSDTWTEEDRNRYIKRAAEEIEEDCVQKRTDYAPLTGTSMATPLVVKIAAEVLLENPEYSVKELIEGMTSKAEHTHMGPLPIKKIRIKKPSWYSNPEIMDNIRTNKSNKINESDYFEFVVPIRK